jgi:hypothetical protein
MHCTFFLHHIVAAFIRVLKQVAANVGLLSCAPFAASMMRSIMPGITPQER